MGEEIIEAPAQESIIYAKNIVKILDARISNALGASASVNLENGGKSFNSSVKNVVRQI